MVQGFLFDGIYTETTGTSIRSENDLIFMTRADETETPLALLQTAESWTNVALDAAIINDMPVLGGNYTIVGFTPHDSLPLATYPCFIKVFSSTSVAGSVTRMVASFHLEKRTTYDCGGNTPPTFKDIPRLAGVNQQKRTSDRYHRSLECVS